MPKVARSLFKYCYTENDKTDDGTKTLFETSLNPSGKGIPKFKKEPTKKTTSRFRYN